MDLFDIAGKLLIWHLTTIILTLWILSFPRYKGVKITREMCNFYFKSDFDRVFFSSDSLWNFIPAIVNKSLPSSYVFRNKRGQICVLFFYWIPLKIYFLKGSQQICCSFDCFIDIRGPKVKSLNCSFKSYFNGLKINIGPYVKWIKICFFSKSRVDWIWTL